MTASRCNVNVIGDPRHDQDMYIPGIKYVSRPPRSVISSFFRILDVLVQGTRVLVRVQQSAVNKTMRGSTKNSIFSNPTTDSAV